MIAYVPDYLLTTNLGVMGSNPVGRAKLFQINHILTCDRHGDHRVRLVYGKRTVSRIDDFEPRADLQIRRDRAGRFRSGIHGED